MTQRGARVAPEQAISDEEFWDQMSRLHSAIAQLIRKRYTRSKPAPAPEARSERPSYLRPHN